MDTTEPSTSSTHGAGRRDPGAPAPADPRPVLADALAQAGAVVAGVHSDQATRPTPCGDMDVEHLVAHLFGVAERIAELGLRGHVDADRPESPVPTDDVVERWDDVATRARRAWSDDARLGATVQVPWDTMTGAQAVAVYVNELAVHAWDLATATGQAPRWDPGVVALAEGAIHDQLPDAVRAPMWEAFAEQMGAPVDPPFADAVEVGAGATPMERLVAWNGRRP